MPLDDIDSDDNKLKILTKQIDLQFKSPLENLFLLKTKKKLIYVWRAMIFRITLFHLFLIESTRDNLQRMLSWMTNRDLIACFRLIQKKTNAN